MTANAHGKGASADCHCLLHQCLLYGPGTVHPMHGENQIQACMKGWADFKLECDPKRSVVTPIFKFKHDLKYLPDLNPAEPLLLKMNFLCSGKGHLDAKHHCYGACA